MMQRLFSKTILLIPWRVRNAIRNLPLVAPLQRWLLERLLEGREFHEHAAALNPFATEFSYPRPARKLDLDEAKRALRLAEEVYAFCQQQLAG